MTPATLTAQRPSPPPAQQSIPQGQHASTKRFRRTTLSCAWAAWGGASARPAPRLAPLAARRRQGNEAAGVRATHIAAAQVAPPEPR
ncbi:hypothetical protein E2C01_064761 [Portunus trituberculatus]|uniref:Uncharacterized protein n=1 Tax=Portunus trituberculatus TaxID=210409 RepID=A0A5B7HCN9_PORTR|nr:hypothetical protein [Portunus trituberculatus]